MENSLGKLDQQKIKYTSELEAALAQYTELQQQVADTAALELDTTCHAIRPDKERETVQRLQAFYGKKFDSRTLAQSRIDVSGLLGEVAESVSIRGRLQKAVEQQNNQLHTKVQEQER